MFQPFTEEKSLAKSSPPHTHTHTKQSTGYKENFEPMVYRQRILAIMAQQMTRADRRACVRVKKKKQKVEFSIKFSSER